MNKKHDIEVIILGKQYTLCGYESEEYLQKIASYINAKYAEYKEKDAFKQLDAELKNILLQINVADDYFKEKEKNVKLNSMNDSKSEEIYDLKHEIIASETKYEQSKKELERTKKELEEARKKIIQLESRLNKGGKTT